MREQFEKEILKRLNDDVWGAGIAANVIHLSGPEQGEATGFGKKFKLYSIGSVAAMAIFAAGVSWVFFQTSSPLKQENNFAKEPKNENSIEKRQTPNYMLRDNLENIIEASINMRLR